MGPTAPLLSDDIYIGRGCKFAQGSMWANPFKVERYGRQGAIKRFWKYLVGNGHLRACIMSLSGRTLRCHCRPTELCHGDSLIRLFQSTCRSQHNYSPNKLHSSPPGPSSGFCAAPPQADQPLSSQPPYLLCRTKQTKQADRSQPPKECETARRTLLGTRVGLPPTIRPAEQSSTATSRLFVQFGSAQVRATAV